METPRQVRIHSARSSHFHETCADRLIVSVLPMTLSRHRRINMRYNNINNLNWSEKIQIKEVGLLVVNINIIVNIVLSGAPRAVRGPGASSNMTDFRFCELQNRRKQCRSFVQIMM